MVCQPAQGHIGVGGRALVQDAVVKAHLGVVLALAALAAGWWFTGGDLTALPQLLRETLHADRLPHSGAKLL